MNCKNKKIHARIIWYFLFCRRAFHLSEGTVFEYIIHRMLLVTCGPSPIDFRSHLILVSCFLSSITQKGVAHLRIQE